MLVRIVKGGGTRSRGPMSRKVMTSQGIAPPMSAV